MDRQPLHLNPVALDLAWNDPEENLARIEAAVESRLEGTSHVPPEAQLFLFPELTLTGFVTKNPAAYGLNPPHPHLLSLCGLAGRLKTGLAVGFPEHNPQDSRRPFNALALIGPEGNIVAKYRKLHLFTAGKTAESTAYSPGEHGSLAVYRGWKVGMAICFDIRFSGLFHQYARAGADILLASSCWIGGPHKGYQYKTINSAHAILTQAYVAAVNRSGGDPFYKYEGAEYVFSPFGENLYQSRPVALQEDILEECRQLSVRPSDRAAYDVKDAG